MKQLTIVGAGWAGLSAAVAATQAGWHVRLYEAAGIAGGRARSLPQSFAGHPLDNGQHVLIGAYRETLALMQTVGLDLQSILCRLPLDLRFADDHGIGLPDWPTPLNLLAGIAKAKGWTLQDKTRLLQATWQWKRARFECPSTWTVETLCQSSGISSCVMTQLIEPLCLSALNTAVHQASGQVFLRVLHDALMSGPGSADLLVPCKDLGAILPDTCLQWLQDQGAEIHLGTRISATRMEALQHEASPQNPILLACPPWEAARLTADIAPSWAYQCAELPYAAIATVYLHCKDTGFQGLSRPMLALRSDLNAPAQFVFDKGALCGQHGLLAAVVSACEDDRDELTEQVYDQVCEQLELSRVEAIQTVVEKRATLACTPMLKRPEAQITREIWACGDYICGPYPSTLEGAVRSGQQVVTQLSQVVYRQGLR
jgi:squalene-associated FAD-dependent desaturase